MKLLLIKCGICDNWHSPKHHCPICGAYHVPRMLAKSGHINRTGIEMVRGIPVSLHGKIERVIRIAESRS